MTRIAGCWRLWVPAALVIMSTALSLQPAWAQQNGTAQCNQFVFQNTLPLLQTANRYNPNGVYPYGFGPVAQPFATTPAEYGLYSVPPPTLSAYSTVPIVAGQPGLGGLPALTPPDLGSLVPPSPYLPAQYSADAIMQQLQSDGTWDRLTATERADWLTRIANVARDQAAYQRDTVVSQRDTMLIQWGIQRDVFNAAIAARRAAYDLSNTVQGLARGWRDSYTSYASQVQSLLSSTCNTTTGQPPTTETLADLALRCRTTTPFDPQCVLVR